MDISRNPYRTIGATLAPVKSGDTNGHRAFHFDFTLLAIFAVEWLIGPLAVLAATGDLTELNNGHEDG